MSVFDQPVKPSLPDFNNHIRTHFSAEGTSGALLIRSYASHGITLIVQFITDDDAFFRTGQNTKPAPFASFFLKNNFWHNISYIETPCTKMQEIFPVSFFKAIIPRPTVY
jgi:hypothetical protein